MIAADRLAALPLFAQIDLAALSVLAARTNERRYELGQVLFAAGSTPTGLLIVVTGRVRVVRGRGDRQHVVHEEGPGGALGEVPVFAGGVYPATAIAAEPTTAFHVAADALMAAARKDPAIALVFLRRLAERTRHLVDRVDRLAAQDVRGRLARFLLERQREAGPGAAFRLGQTQGALAEELGTVREVLVRALRQLREAGIVAAEGGGVYRVVAPDRLAGLAE